MFAVRLAEAVAYAKVQGDQPARSQAIYGGVPPELNSFVVDAISSILDAQAGVPSP